MGFEMNIKKIESAQLFIVKIPLKEPFGTSCGLVTDRESLLLRLRCGDFEGWGECTAFADPFYTYETLKTAQHICRDYLLPEVLTLRDIGLSKIGAAFSSVRGHPMAKAMVENGVLDLFAKINEKPLFEVIGGEHKKVKSGIAIGTKASIDDLLKSVQIGVSKKYHRIKIKIKPGADVELLKAIRSTFPGIALSVDANGCYVAAQLDHLKEFDAFDLDMIEQPLESGDLRGHALLKKTLVTPICLDESIEGLVDAKAAKAFDACSIVNVKQSRVGGILNGVAVAQYCTKNGIEVWSGGMLETGIGRAVNIHLQTVPGFETPGDTSETSRYFEQDIVDQPVVLDGNGYIDVPSGNGIGVTVNQKRLEKFCSSQEKIQ